MLELYDGVTSLFDVTVDPDGTGATAGTSIKSIWRSVETDITTDLFSYQVFGQSTWEIVREGVSRMAFVLMGYVSGGMAYSKPGSLKGLPPEATMVIQYDTGCTITFNPKVSRDRNQGIALGETARVVEGRCNGEPTIAWIVA